MIKVRVKFFLQKGQEEIMPTTRDQDGIILIRQNIDISCVSDNPQFVSANSQVDDLEGFFCILTYIGGSDTNKMPRYVKVSAFAKGKKDHKELYSEKVAEFEVQLTSEISIE